MICPNCKAENSNNDKFCWKCGSVLNSAPVQQVPEIENKEIKNAYPTQNSEPIKTKATKKSKKKFIFILVCFILILAVVGFIVGWKMGFFAKHKNDFENTNYSKDEYINELLDEHKDSAQTLIYDFDENGTNELVLLYQAIDEGVEMLVDVFTTSGDTVVPLIQREYAFSLENDGYIAVAKNEGETYLSLVDGEQGAKVFEVGSSILLKTQVVYNAELGEYIKTEDGENKNISKDDYNDFVENFEKEVVVEAKNEIIATKPMVTPEVSPSVSPSPTAEPSPTIEPSPTVAPIPSKPMTLVEIYNDFIESKAYRYYTHSCNYLMKYYTTIDMDLDGVDELIISCPDDINEVNSKNLVFKYDAKNKEIVFLDAYYTDYKPLYNQKTKDLLVYFDDIINKTKIAYRISLENNELVKSVEAVSFVNDDGEQVIVKDEYKTDYNYKSYIENNFKSLKWTQNFESSEDERVTTPFKLDSYIEDDENFDFEGYLKSVMQQQADKKPEETGTVTENTVELMDFFNGYHELTIILMDATDVYNELLVETENYLAGGKLVKYKANEALELTEEMCEEIQFIFNEDEYGYKVLSHVLLNNATALGVDVFDWTIEDYKEILGEPLDYYEDVDNIDMYIYEYENDFANIYLHEYQGGIQWILMSLKY